MSDELACLNAGDEPVNRCEGRVELREPLSASGRSFPRCERHWGLRLDEEERLRRDYPDSPFPPPWFDPLAAGETWDDE